MKGRTSALSGPALDWAAAQCAGPGQDGGSARPYSTCWAHGGPLLERERLYLSTDQDDGGERDWWAEKLEGDTVTGRRQAREYGPTPLIAALRCLVAFHLGHEVELPDDLRLSGPLVPKP